MASTKPLAERQENEEISLTASPKTWRRSKHWRADERYRPRRLAFHAVTGFFNWLNGRLITTLPALKKIHTNNAIRARHEGQAGFNHHPFL